MARVRLREVASLAGVSEATVSRVINERPHVGARTKAAVIAALEQLDAPLPGGTARTTSSSLAGLIVADFDNPIFGVMSQLIADRLLARGRNCVVARCGGGLHEFAVLESLEAAGAGGAIVVSGAHADLDEGIERYQQLIDGGLKLVFVNGFRPALTGAPFVSCDDARAAGLAVSHLASLGHRRIGFISGPRHYTVVRRKLAGYRSALAAAGLDVDEQLVVETMFSAEAGQAAVAGLVDNGATCAVAVSDLLALGSVRGARDLGLEVPRDWSVTGYDDTALMAYTDPPLTTVRQPVRAMCHAAADMLAAQLDGAPPRGGELVFRPELVVRASTATRR